MDSNTNIRLYQNCDELPMYNFEQIRNKQDYTWLVHGYDGFGSVVLPINAPEVWDNIINEYSTLTENNRTLEYFDIIVDGSDMEVRIVNATALLKQLDERPLMDEETKKMYTDELAGWRFYYNYSKDHEKEIERLINQLEVVKQKHRMLAKEKEDFEGKQEKGDLIKLKVLVQNAIKRHIDLRQVSVKEWVYTLDNLKTAA